MGPTAAFDHSAGIAGFAEDDFLCAMAASV
jgi:hypothetical protein